MRILIISPQPWQGMRLSKHHYAVALSELGHDVYFLNPPQRWRPFSNGLSVHEEDGVKIIESGMMLPMRLGQLIPGMARQVVVAWCKKIVRHTGILDVVWCFDNYGGRISDLREWGARKAVLHVVDNSPNMLQHDMNADLLIGISEKCLAPIDTSKPKKVVDHALSPAFLKREALNIEGFAQTRVGYFGNLTFEAINHHVLNRCMEEIENVEWHFWGPIRQGDNSSEEVKRFVALLEKLENVHYHDTLSPEELVADVHEKKISHFISLYRPEVIEDRGGDSHKMLEYLSFGIPVISNYISRYEGLDIVDAPPPAKGEWTVDEIRNKLFKIDDEEMQIKRRAFVSDKAYVKKAKTILSTLSIE